MEFCAIHSRSDSAKHGFGPAGTECRDDVHNLNHVSVRDSRRFEISTDADKYPSGFDYKFARSNTQKGKDGTSAVSAPCSQPDGYWRFRQRRLQILKAASLKDLLVYFLIGP